MDYHALADLMLVIHALFIVFVVCGGLLTLRWRWVVWLHLPAVVWAVLLEVFGWLCPLTPLEQSLRQATGAASYSGGFVEHYLVQFIYPAGLTRAVQLYLAAGVILVNIVVYGLVIRRRRKYNR
ncbi:MAG: DUF2784 domain-containing protein [Gammaproteobacteria bacterium]|jgi:hypothetical protein|nr:DUF2784 domain-containing protein [Gammaproteobacteria bacterium]